MLTESESIELECLAAAWDRLDDIDPDEVDPDEYQRMLARLVELRKKRDELTAADLIRMGNTPEAKAAVNKRGRFG